MYLRQVSDQNISFNEESRLKKLYDYEVLNTPAEESFNNFAQLAAEVFEVTDAAIGFFDKNGTFIKALIGNSAAPESNKSLFNLIKTANQDVVTSNASEFVNINDPSFSFQFFAGALIKSPEGQILGAIMVHGQEFQTATQNQLNMLNRLAGMISEKLEMRMALRKTLRAQDDRLHVLIHDLKNPMTTISLQSELVSRMPGADERTVTIAEKITSQSKRMVDSLNQILSSARRETGSFKPQKNKIDLQELLSETVKDLNVISKNKNQAFTINIDTLVEIFGDEIKLGELFFQLLHNASKFSPADSEIHISHQMAENLVTVAIKDQGVGLNETDLDHLFMKFSQLSSAPTHHENSNGLGLITARMFVDMHKGRIWATSEGKNKGTTFFVELPLK